MNRILMILFIGASSAASATLAQDAPARPQKLESRVPAVIAAVDAEGRVLPVSPYGDLRVPDRVGGAPNGLETCPATVALSVEAAKQLVLRVAGEENFYPEFVAAVAKVESSYVTTKVSPKGAFGLMQLMPATADELQVDLCDPQANVRGGIRKLRALNAKYRNPFYILAAYNAGEQALIENHGVPPYPETMNYIARVMNEFYGWPKIGAAGALRAETGKSPARGAGPKNAGASKREAEGWQSGFVMSFEYN